jgi:hypothetical protein
MKARLDHLKRRRALLTSQAAAQRTALAFLAQDLQHHLRFVDMGFSLVQVMRKHPALSIMSATLLLPAPRNKLLLWSSRLLTSWKVFALVRKQWRNAQ